ncbi:hypothetical protein [Streptomyces sp. SCA2-2]|uniref:hypothetical protein n=1 Tax=Streptomyces sp. SCA2-2 TaxID=1563677 RepID=UPI001F5C17E2|nr:hypothetical protein [Streptomyces sp. SCA2-2]
MTVHTLVTALPDPELLRARCRALALLDALLDGLPPSLAHYPEDPEFQFEGFFDATVCVWREKNAPTWSCGPVTFTADESDGADGLFDLLTDGTPDTYVA